MELSQSTINQAEKPWLQYCLAIYFGIVAFMVSLMPAGISPQASSRWLPLTIMLLSGLAFSSLGFFAMIKDAKGFGVAALAAGSMLVGIAPFIIQ